MKWIAGLLVLVAACKDPPPPPPPPAPVKLSDAQKAEVHRLIDEAKARVKTAEKARDAAFESPGAITDKPCPIGRRELGIEDGITKNGLTTKLLGMTRLITPDAKPEKRIGVTSAHLDTNASILTMHLDEELKYGKTADSVIAETKRELALEVPAYELALVLEDFSNPELRDDKTFEGGQTRGKLYVYSETARAVICAAEVGSESAQQIEVHTTRDTSEADRRVLSSAHLTGELIVSTIDGGLGRLRAVASAAH